jgi:hypothetical protein
VNPVILKLYTLSAKVINVTFDFGSILTSFNVQVAVFCAIDIFIPFVGVD